MNVYRYIEANKNINNENGKICFSGKKFYYWFDK